MNCISICSWAPENPVLRASFLLFLRDFSSIPPLLCPPALQLSQPLCSAIKTFGDLLLTSAKGGLWVLLPRTIHMDPCVDIPVRVVSLDDLCIAAAYCTMFWETQRRWLPKDLLTEEVAEEYRVLFWSYFPQLPCHCKKLTISPHRKNTPGQIKHKNTPGPIKQL